MCDSLSLSFSLPYYRQSPIYDLFCITKHYSLYCDISDNVCDDDDENVLFYPIKVNVIFQ